MHPVSNVMKVDLAALSLNADPNVNHTAAKQITQLKYRYMSGKLVIHGTYAPTNEL